MNSSETTLRKQYSLDQALSSSSPSSCSSPTNATPSPFNNHNNNQKLLSPGISIELDDFLEPPPPPPPPAAFCDSPTSNKSSSSSRSTPSPNTFLNNISCGDPSSDPIKTPSSLPKGSATPPQSPLAQRKEIRGSIPSSYSGIIFSKFPDRLVNESYPHHYHSEPTLSLHSSLNLLPISEDDVSDFASSPPSTNNRLSVSSVHLDRSGEHGLSASHSPRIPRRAHTYSHHPSVLLPHVSDLERGSIASLPRGGESRPRTFSAPEKSLQTYFSKPAVSLTYRRIHPSSFALPPKP